MQGKEKYSADSRRNVGATLEALCEAWNRHDVDAMGALFATDADFVNVVGMHFKGRGEISKAHRELHKDRFANTRLKHLNASVEFLTDHIALAHVRWEMAGDPAVAAGAVRRGVMSHILVRRDGEWSFRATQNTDVVHLPQFADHPFWSKYL